MTKLKKNKFNIKTVLSHGELEFKNCMRPANIKIVHMSMMPPTRSLISKLKADARKPDAALKAYS